MKLKDVTVGETYIAKVNDNITRVHIYRDCGYHTDWRGNTRHCGWYATNLSTGRKIHIRTAARLRAKVTGNNKASLVGLP